MGDPARGARGAGRRVACAAGLIWRQDRLDGLPLLGSRTRYTPADAAALFEALDRLDANARAVYSATGLTIDMVFPAACGSLFAILLVCLFRAPFLLLPLADNTTANRSMAGCCANHRPAL